MEENILYINKEEIELFGFSKIQDMAYFIIRSNGVFISGKQEDVIALQIEERVANRKIKSCKLIKLLNQKGFDGSHVFLEIGNSYVCENPCFSDLR